MELPPHYSRVGTILYNDAAKGPTHGTPGSKAQLYICCIGGAGREYIESRYPIYICIDLFAIINICCIYLSNGVTKRLKIAHSMTAQALINWPLYYISKRQLLLQHGSKND